MAQRGNSKKAKHRQEEEELDRQLMDAGLLDDGMSLAQKRELAQILSFSVSSAQEEESQRRTREIEEEKIIEKTLDKSINIEKDLQDDDENSRGSDIVILSGGPESDSQVSRSSQLSKGISGLDRSQTTEKSSQHISRCNSDQDLFCDSQGGPQEHQNNLVTPESEKKIEKSISTTSADSASENAQKSLETVQKTYVPVTSRRGIRKHPSADEIASPSAKALRRHATVHEVPSPSTKAQSNLGINEKVQSQPLFVSGSSNITVRRDKHLQSSVDSEEDTQLFSPVIGARKVINGRTVNASQNLKSSNVQESQISNSLEVVHLHPKKLNNENDSSTDDEIFSSPVQSPSILKKNSTPAGVLSNSRLSAISTPNTSNVNLRLSVSPGMSPAMEKSPIKSLSIPSASQNPVIKNQIVVDDVKKTVGNDDATQEIVVTPSVSSTDKVLASSTLEENISTLHSDKESENSSDANDNCSYSINKKSFFNVFPLSKSDTEPLQRKNMRSEKRNLAYLKHENETVNESKKRIISLIDTSCNILKNYQGLLGRRMKWVLPVVVDKRVKEWTLNRPIQNTRKIMPTSSEDHVSGIKRATRQTRKVRGQNQGGDSDDSLPDIIQNSQDSKLKPSSQRRLVGGKFSNNVDDKRRITNDSDDDLDDFDVIPSNHSKQFGKISAKKADSTPRNHTKSYKDVDNVTSSRLQDDIKTNSEEKNINFELDVNDSGNDDDKKHISEGNYMNTPKRKPNDSFEQSRPIKRRKTFMLNVEEDEVASSSNISENIQQDEVIQSSHNTEVTSVVDEGEERSKYFCDKNLKDEVGGLVSSQEQKKETNYVSSSYEESHNDGFPGPSSSSADLFILENTNAKTVNNKSTSSTTNTKGASKSQQRVQIRPGRLKIAGRRNNGKGRGAPNEEGEQISSSLEQDAAVIDNGIKVECPLCAREFPQNKIEVHASTCNGQVDSTVEEDDEPSLFQRAAENATVKSGFNTEAATREDASNRRPIAATASEKRPRTPPTFVRCYLCNEVFPEGDEYAIHVGRCDGQQKVVEGIKSPSSTASPRTWATHKSAQRVAKPIQPYGNSTANVKKRSVFEQLEGSGPSRSRTTAPPRKSYDEMKDSVNNNPSEESDDYDFPDSPIRSFVPISQLTDSEIDYHNQYRDKSRKVAAGSTKAGSKAKKKKKSNRGKSTNRGKSRKRGK